MGIVGGPSSSPKGTPFFWVCRGWFCFCRRGWCFRPQRQRWVVPPQRQPKRWQQHRLAPESFCGGSCSRERAIGGPGQSLPKEEEKGRIASLRDSVVVCKEYPQFYYYGILESIYYFDGAAGKIIINTAIALLCLAMQCLHIITES